MRKMMTGLMALILIMFSGCSAGKTDVLATPDSVVAEGKAVDNAPTEETASVSTEHLVDTAALFKDMSGEYVCTAGTKGGATLYLSTDGSFVGYYNYFVTAVGDESAPHGVFQASRYTCAIGNVQFVAENIYLSDINELEYESEPGTEEIRGGIRYLYTTAEHIASYDEFYIFSPKTKFSQLPDDSLLWLGRSKNLDNKGEEIGMYLLYNKKSGETFYQRTKAELIPGKPLEDSDEYTGEKLLSMSIPEIIDLMDRDITVRSDSEYYFIFPTGYVYFYNFNKLPGFVFYIRPPHRSGIPADYYTEDDLAEIKRELLSGAYNKPECISIIGGARLNNIISTDYTYNQISFIRKDFNLDIKTGAGYRTQDVSSVCSEGVHAVVTYAEPDEPYDEKNGNEYSYLIKKDPKVKYIVLNQEEQ